MFDELNAAFPNHTHFYEVVGLTLAEAMDRSARLTGGDSHILNYQGKVIFAVQHDVNVSGFDWLIEVPGAPVVEETAPVDEAPVEEEAVVEETVVEAEPTTTTKSK